ncbi:MAG: glycosyl transferase family protein [Burkholderiaceae bacterium]|nr:glycosyl transferase family protein [Burkholderiaceae bacterium]
MSAEVAAFLLAWREPLEIAILAMACSAIVLSVDDFIVDISYWWLRLRGRLRENHGLPPPDELARLPEKPLAVMVPAWHESDVIHAMLTTNARLMQYKAVHYFVGVYENDPDTLREVRRAQAVSSRIHAVILPREGPTSKADCLNEIIGRALAMESELGLAFEGFVMHDAEDLIHPMELRVFNAALDQYDFVQLPVYSFTRRLRDLVAGVYMDEFAENHGKDLQVREALGGFVPCAGVSACFSRRAIGKLGERQAGEVFPAGSLTEDYEAAFHLSEIGLHSAFIRYTADYYMDTPRGSGAPKLVRQDMTVSTREHFPDAFRAAYRQRARWNLGIVLVGNDQLGWTGSRGTRLFLARDRKGVIAVPAVMIGYVLFVTYVALRLVLYFGWGDVPGSSVMDTAAAWWLIGASLLLALWRMGHRMHFTSKLYGWRHGLMSLPRFIVGNFVNFWAMCRAVRLYTLHRLFGKPLSWDKTAHTYPDTLATQLPSLLAPGLSRQPAMSDAAARAELERAMGRPPGSLR